MRVEKNLCPLPENQMAIFTQGGIGIYDLATQKRVCVLQDSDGMRDFRYFPNGENGEIVGCAGEMVKTWNPSTGACTETVQVQSLRDNKKIHFLPDNRLISLANNAVCIVNVDGSPSLEFHLASERDHRFCSIDLLDNSTLAFVVLDEGPENNTIKVYNGVTGKCECTWTQPPLLSRHNRLTVYPVPDSARFLTMYEFGLLGLDNKAFKIWDSSQPLATGQDCSQEEFKTLIKKQGHDLFGSFNNVDLFSTYLSPDNRYAVCTNGIDAFVADVEKIAAQLKEMEQATDVIAQIFYKTYIAPKQIPSVIHHAALQHVYALFLQTESRDIRDAIVQNFGIITQFEAILENKALKIDEEIRVKIDQFVQEAYFQIAATKNLPAAVQGLNRQMQGVLGAVRANHNKNLFSLFSSDPLAVEISRIFSIPILTTHFLQASSSRLGSQGV